jgi:hypothetical protein
MAQERVMYGGKTIAAGDRLYVIASEHFGGTGLAARAWVTASRHVEGIVWEVAFKVDALATAPLGRDSLRQVTPDLDEPGAPEIAFKFYRQATNKTAGVSAATADWLEGHFS